MTAVDRIVRACAAAASLLALLLAAAPAPAQIVHRASSSSSAFVPPSLVTNVNPASATLGAVGSAITIGFRGAASDTDTTSPISIPMPAGTVEDDIMVAAIFVTPSTVTGINAPAGWTSIENTVQSTDAPGTRIVVFWKRAVAGEAGPYAFTTAAGTSAGMAGQILTFSGVEGTNPFVSEGAGTTTTPGNVATFPNRAAPGMTNTMLVGFGGYSSGSVWSTPSGGMTKAQATDPSSHAVPNANGVSMTGAYQAWPTNVVTNARTTTATSGGAANNEGLVGFSALLRPAPPITLQKPSGLQSGDAMFVSIAIKPTTNAIAVATMSVQAPAGWTLVRRQNSATAGTSGFTSLFIFGKIATGSEPASYTFAAPGAAFGVGGILAYRGLELATPVDNLASVGTASAATHATPSFATSVDDTAIVAAFAYSSGRAWNTVAPAGLTERIDNLSSSSTDNGVSMSVWDGTRATAGTVGPFTGTPVAGNNDVGATLLLAMRPGCRIGIPVPTAPAALVAGDLMVASISVRSSAAVVTGVPSGWTLLDTQNSLAGDTLTLRTYTKVATGAETGPYIWAFDDCAWVAGGIQAFGGVNTSATPTVGKAATASSDIHTAPSINPPAAGSMLVPIFSYSSSATSWTRQPGSLGMTERHHSSHPPPAATVGVDVVGYSEPWSGVPPAGTGTRAARASNDAGIGVTMMIALRPVVVPVTVGGFNAYEPAPTTGPGAISGVIKTKVAGASASVDVIALNALKNAIETGFTGTVRVEVLDASNNSGPLDAGTNCRSSWTVIQTLADVTFNVGDNGRKTVSFTHANSYKNARIRIALRPDLAVIGCSNDNFAIRPLGFTGPTVTDNDAQTAGNARTLNNASVPGGTVHKAGRPFSIAASAVNNVASTTTNYVDTPTATLTACGGSGCTTGFGTLALGGTFAAGVLASSTATYSEVGAFQLQLVDSTFADVDAGDSSAAEREIKSAVINVGRFVPDHFAVSLNTPSFATACSAGNFTYIGQAFTYNTQPQITVTAERFPSGTTALYTGALWQITNATLTPGIQAARYSAATGTLDTTGMPAVAGDPAITAGSPAAGQGTLTFGSGSGLLFTRSTPVAPFNAEVSLAINVIDADGVTATSNPVRFAQATAGNGIAFSTSKSMRFGRLAVGNRSGSQLVPLRVPMEVQYWDGKSFITNVADSCTTLAAPNFALGPYQPNLNACETSVTVGGFASGRANVQLSPSGQGNNGSVTVTANLGGNNGSTCIAGAAVTPATGANRPYLQGNWTGAAYDQNPSGRATFGVYRGAEEVIFLRENF